MRNKFLRFMYGRYGVDELSRFLVLVALLIQLASRSLFFLILSNSILLITIFRTFSKDLFKRRNEGYLYLCYKHRISSLVKNKIQQVKDYSKFKYFRCPNCRQQLRVPRHKGNITIICTKCRFRFEARS